ncbi:MAG: PKD domain-containing protein [Solirubrobacterales bacterium]|nr:PKD domain-containing protein [Solirubrobacterales bacterium]
MSTRGRHRGNLLLGACVALLAATLACTTPALATTTEPYGEVSRFGGFASPAAPGKFVLPVGFAVDPADPTTSDHNAVYVLDRVIKKPGKGELQYRLQKLSSTGTVLGAVTLPLEKFTDTTTYSDSHPLISLAVDSAKHRVYALVEGLVNDGGGRYVPVAQRLVAWSTEPNPTSKELVPVAGYPVDPVTGAALIAGSNESKPSELEPESIGSDLYAPEGLTVAPSTVDPSDDDVVIEAQRGLREGPFGGPTILQRVSAEGPNSGKLDGDWVANSAIAPNTEQSDGVFTANNGSFGVDLYNEWGHISSLAEVKPNFGTPEAALIAADQSKGANLDEAPSIDPPDTINYNSNHGGQYETTDFETTAAGTPFTQLSNGLYAARYAVKVGGGQPVDPQGGVAPWDDISSPPLFWLQNAQSHEEIGNLGIRLFTAAGVVETTVGGGAEGHPCNLDFQQLAIAAGAEGSLFVLTQPNLYENSNGQRDSDDQVIEFAPGKGTACPHAEGAFEVDKVEIPETSSVKVDQKVPVEFNAISIKREGEVPYEFDWNFEGKKSGGNAGTSDGYEVEPDGKMAPSTYLWPNPEATHTYEKAGTYEASLRLMGDYGTKIFSVKVKVEPSEPAFATFTGPEPIAAGTPVTFDAQGSKGTPGSTIAEYHWEFGDGSAPSQTQTPQSKPHTFANPGEYEVTLAITDEVGEKAHVTKKFKVVAPASGAQPTQQPQNNGPSLTSPGVTGNAITNPLVKRASTPKALTTAQKLAKALRACKKRKSKKQRASCEKQAKRKYATKAKKGRKGKKK